MSSTIYELLQYGWTVTARSTTDEMPEVIYTFVPERDQTTGTVRAFSYSENGVVVQSGQRLLLDQNMHPYTFNGLEVIECKEIRGSYEVTTYPGQEGQEWWQIAYTDGTRVEEGDLVTAESGFPECHLCHRWIGPQDNAGVNIWNNELGQMTCILCRPA